MSAVPLQGQVRTARILAASRARTLRGAPARFGAWAAFLVLCSGLAAAGSVADLIRESARTELSELFGIDQARTVLGWVLANPDRVVMVAGGFVLGTALFTVASAATPGRLVDVPYGHLVASGATTRFLESLLTSLMSVVPVMQLLVLTAAAGLLTVDRQGRAGAVVLAWLLWALAQVVTAAAMWALVVVRRARSVRLNRALVAGGVVLSGAAAALVASGAMAWFVRALLEVPALVGIVLAPLATVAAFRIGVAMTARAGQMAPTLASTGSQRSARIAGGPWRAVLHSVALAAWRTSQVRSPLLTVTLTCMVALVAAGRSDQALPGVAVGLPVAWSLAFTSNFLAVHGSGALWFGTLPRVGRPLLGAAAAVGLAGCLAPLLLAPLPALLLGTVEPGRLGGYALLGVAASVLLTGASVLLATAAPQPASTAHGQPLLTPGRTLVWMLLLGALAGLAWLAVEATSVLVGMGEDWPGWPYVGAAGTTVLGVALLALAWSMWPRLRARAMAKAGTA